MRLRGLREDPEGFGETYEEAVVQPLDFTRERLRGQNPPDGTFTLGAFDGALVGIVTVVRSARVKLRHRADIFGMYVAPEARRAGVGRALLAEVRARAEQIAGLEQLHLFVMTTNEPARRLYRAMGFVTYGIEPHAVKLDDRYWDEELMVLQLRPSS